VHDLIVEAEPWDGAGAAQRRSWKMVTLTARANQNVDNRFDSTSLRREVRRVRRAFAPFWRSLAWGRQVRNPGFRGKRSRKDTSYIFAQEVSPSGMVHIHALVYGEFILQRVLEAAWSHALGEKTIVDVRTIRNVAGSLREVLKYATKGEKNSRDQAVRAAAVEVAFRNVHRVALGGAVRRVRISDSSGATEDIRTADLHNQRELACQECGVVGEWKWVGIVSEAVVNENGGFGPMRGWRPDTYSPG
jgi:hypothetical protein